MQHIPKVAPRNNRTERLFITWTNINRFTQSFTAGVTTEFAIIV